VVGHCILCLVVSELRNSHIVPSLVRDWLVETSETGYLRDANMPNKRVQDLPKYELLCEQCEQRIGRYENLFSEMMFKPYVSGSERSFEYGDWLGFFAMSLAFRNIAMHRQDSGFDTEFPQLNDVVDRAYETFRNYLNGDTKDPGPYEHHVLFLNDIRSATLLDIPSKFNSYVRRGVDISLPSGEWEIYSYVKLPGIVFWTSIHPYWAGGWKGTLVGVEGQLKVPQQVDSSVFLQILVSRAEETQEAFAKMSEKQLRKIEAALSANRKRIGDTPE
jgi:hypothetical protein